MSLSRRNIRSFLRPWPATAVLTIDLLGWLGDERHWPIASLRGRAPKQPLIVVEHHEGFSMLITSPDAKDLAFLIDKLKSLRLDNLR